EALGSAGGDSGRVGAEHRRIAELLRGREFGLGGAWRNALAGLDRDAAIDAFGAALRLDLRLRADELSRAVARSRLAASSPAPDPHLRDPAHRLGLRLV